MYKNLISYLFAELFPILAHQKRFLEKKYKDVEDSKKKEQKERKKDDTISLENKMSQKFEGFAGPGRKRKLSAGSPNPSPERQSRKSLSRSPRTLKDQRELRSESKSPRAQGQRNRQKRGTGLRSSSSDRVGRRSETRSPGSSIEKRLKGTSHRNLSDKDRK